MIDWEQVATNGLWVLGVSVVLAVLSYHDWMRRTTVGGRSNVFTQSSFQVCWALGMFLTSTGWALSQSIRWWDELLFLVLGAFFLWRMATIATSGKLRRGA